MGVACAGRNGRAERLIGVPMLRVIIAGGDMLYWLESEYKFCPCCGTRMFTNKVDVNEDY